MMRALFSLLLISIVVAQYPVLDQRTITAAQLAKIRCSLNSNDETFFFFNGTVIAYPGDLVTNNRVLFKTVGINVGRCWKRPDGTYSLASRELLYYIDPVTDQIVNSWTNPWTNETLNVAHVDNDPVLQNFTGGSTYPILIAGDNAILNLDIPLFYPNSLSFDPRMAQYSPQPNYRAGEFFKFIVPTKDLYSDADTASYALVSWTRVGPWLPWMKQGNTPGYLLYSSQGARIPDWTYMPAQVKADLENRIPHYKNAPSCIPNTRSVTSWSFFSANFVKWQSGERFPLTTPAAYGCIVDPTPAAPTCQAKATVNAYASWISNGKTYYSCNVVLKNVGTQAITALSVAIDNTVVETAWNLQKEGSSNVHKVALWNPFQAGATLSGSYGFNSFGGDAVVAVVNARC